MTYKFFNATVKSNHELHKQFNLPFYTTSNQDKIKKAWDSDLGVNIGSFLMDLTCKDYDYLNKSKDSLVIWDNMTVNHYSQKFCELLDLFPTMKAQNLIDMDVQLRARVLTNDAFFAEIVRTDTFRDTVTPN